MVQSRLDDELVGRKLGMLQYDRCDALCDRYSYPEKLRELLRVVVSLADEFLIPKSAIVLSPSISTGDFVWSGSGDSVILLSDIDGFVFTDAKEEQKRRFQTALQSASQGLGGPHFKIDFSISTMRALGRIPRTFQMAETRLGGFELVGDGVLSCFPVDFDPRHSRQAFLLNLWKPLEDSDEVASTQGVARLLLDVPLLASSELGICRPGHRARTEWFIQEQPGALGKSATLRQAVEVALAVRQLRLPGDRLRELLVPALAETIGRLDGAGLPPDRANAQLARRFASWLPPRSVRRLLGELAGIIRRPTTPVSDMTWWISRKEAVGGAALWGLLQVVYSQTQPCLETAICLAKYARRETIEIGRDDFVSLARDQYREGFHELYPSRR